MTESTQYKGEEAIPFLRELFGNVPAGSIFMGRIYGVEGKDKSVDTNGKVSMAGFSQERRIQNGKLDEVKSRRGAVTLFGDDQPDFCLMVEYNKRNIVFALDDVTVQMTGFADTVLHLSSTKWKNASAIDIYVKKVYYGSSAISYLQDTILNIINEGQCVARYGKWASTKIFDRSTPRDEAEILGVTDAFTNPEADRMRTMMISSDILKIEFIPSDSENESPHSLRSEHKNDSNTLTFNDLVIEPEVPGKELGEKKKLSTYIYFLGTPKNSPTNCLVIRHPSSGQS